jgi:HK97 family phage portal protein
MAWYNTPIRWPFRRTQEQEKAITGIGGGVFVPTVSEPFGPSTYDAFAVYGYRKNSTANMCIRLIARSIAGLPLKIFFTQTNREGEEVEIFVDNHPLWKKVGETGQPNIEMSWNDFNQAYWAYAFLDGNNYIFAAGDENNPELWPLRPDRIEQVRAKPPIPGMRPITVAYKHTVDGETTPIPADKILHTKTFNPQDDFLGMPLLEPAAVEVDQSNYSGLWNVSLLKHGGRPSLFISVPQGESPPTPEQKLMLKEWATQNIEGFSKAGKIVVVPGMDLKEVGMNPKDMDWLRGNIQARVAIANTCGVPPELIGIQDQKTYANYQEARKAFYEETVIPLADDYFRSLTNFLGRRFKNERRGFVEDVTIAVDRERVEALQEGLDSRHKRWRDDFSAGTISINEWRAEFGFKPVKGGDDIFVPANLLPLDLIASGDDDSEIMPVTPPPIEEEEMEEENE